MLIRAATALSFVITLAACGETEEPACCAIAPKAKCDAALGALHVTDKEAAALFGPGAAACPTDALSLERIRELDSQWPQACRESGMMSPALALDRPACRAPDLDTLSAPAGIDVQAWGRCGEALKARGLRDNELWVMLHSSEGICPNAGVSEARIREILANDWEAAQCTHGTKDDMLKALDSGACGGDAG